MLFKPDPASQEELEQSNRELKAGLARCEALVDAYKERLEAGGEASFMLSPQRREKNSIAAVPIEVINEVTDGRAG